MTEKPLFLELFPGSRSLGVQAEKAGFDVVSVDFKPFDKIDLVMDILDFEISQLSRSPAVIWASPPCTTYSIASVGYHRDGPLPTSDEALIADRLVSHVVDLCVESAALWYIENPRGMLRKCPMVKGLDRRTVMYCRYGAQVMKPTDIWSNNFRSLFNPKGFQPRPMCFNSNFHCHHMPSPRGSQGGVQSLSNAYERSKIPADLCIDVVQASLRCITADCSA